MAVLFISNLGCLCLHIQVWSIEEGNKLPRLYIMYIRDMQENCTIVNSYCVDSISVPHMSAGSTCQPCPFNSFICVAIGVNESFENTAFLPSISVTQQTSLKD